MRVKIIGIGKCGSRLTYDFFAYISDTPTAYELKARQNSKFWSYMVDRYPRIASFDRKRAELSLARQQLAQNLFGKFLIFDQAFLVTMDSDIRNNEIISWIQFINEKGKSYVFPGRSFPFADHEGGCDYHIVSENLCANWRDIDDDIISTDGADFVVTAFSVGGGTGGGAAPLISYESKHHFRANRKSRETEQVHFMGLGVLPFSDEPYRGEDYMPDMSASEKYNTGRFFARLYGLRNAENPELHMDSIWLVSNDALSMATATMLDEQQPNLSLINKYLAASLTVICNATSKATQSEPNFDPSEMNSRLNGYPFISGYASLVPEKGVDIKLHANAVRAILHLALSNATVNDSGQLQGLSMPMRESELVEVTRILEEKGQERLMASLKTYDLAQAPLEFRTAARVVMIYGQPKDAHSPYKDDLIRDITSTLFQNSKLDSYYFKHPGTVDIVLILIVNPFVRFIQKAIYYYTDISWVKGAAEDEFFDDLLLQWPFDRTGLDRILLDEEQILDEFHGQNIVQLINGFDQPIKLGREQVINAFHHLNNTLHYKKTDVSRKSRI